jgi:hypothetical protein
MASVSLEQQFARYKQRLAVKLGQAGLILEGEYHDIVAIDTGRLDKSIKTGPVVDRGNLLSVDVGSEGVFYAIFVDQGVKGRTYNYHRNGRVVYSGVGQRYMERGLIAKQDEIRAKLLEARIQ